LCNAVVDENLTEPQRARLESWLVESIDARVYYIRAMDLSANLAHQASEMQMEAPDGPGRFLRFVQAVRWRWMAFAAAVLVAVGFWAREWSPPAASSNAAEPIEYVARITGENAVVWKKGVSELKPGAFLRRGQHVELASGFAEITFDSGAVVLLSGPAVLEVNSAWISTLRRGAVKVSVPSQAIGFRVSNSAVDVVDMGTEFSMVADDQGGAEVLVLKGKVQAVPRGHEDPEAVELQANDARHFAGSEQRNPSSHLQQYYLLADDPQRPRHLRQNIRRLQKVFSLVRRAHNRPQPRLTFRHGGKSHGCREHSRLKQFPGKFKRFRRIPHVNRNDRRLARLELEFPLLQFFFEIFRIRP
jgi:hypothetical protein